MGGFGVLVGVVLEVACLVVGRIFYKLRFTSPTSYSISKNKIRVYDYPSMKLGLRISNYEISM